MDESQLEHEQFLETALEDMEYGGRLTDDQIACIRQACGKSKPRNGHVDPLLQEVVNSFASIFGNPVAQIPTI